MTPTLMLPVLGFVFPPSTLVELPERIPTRPLHPASEPTPGFSKHPVDVLGSLLDGSEDNFASGAAAHHQGVAHAKTTPVPDLRRDDDLTF